MIGDEANENIGAEDFSGEELRECDIDRNTNRYEAAIMRYIEGRKALLDEKWKVTKTCEVKDKKLRGGILIKVTSTPSTSNALYERLYGRIGRLISAITTQRWNILFRKDGVDVDTEEYIADDFKDGAQLFENIS